MLEQFLPFAAVAVLVCASLGMTLRNALPAISGLRRELAECPEMREVRYTVRELRFVSRINVVKLPVRQRVRVHGQRAAA